MRSYVSAIDDPILKSCAISLDCSEHDFPSERCTLPERERQAVTLCTSVIEMHICG